MGRFTCWLDFILSSLPNHAKASWNLVRPIVLIREKAWVYYRVPGHASLRDLAHYGWLCTFTYITADGHSISSQLGSSCQGNRYGTKKAGDTARPSCTKSDLPVYSPSDIQAGRRVGPAQNSLQPLWFLFLPSWTVLSCALKFLWFSSSLFMIQKLSSIFKNFQLQQYLDFSQTSLVSLAPFMQYKS